MATNFSNVTPTWCIPIEPDFHLIVSQAESMKKNYQNFSGSTPVHQYRLQWPMMSDTNFATLNAHYSSTSGGYASFTWTCVPSYIDTDHDGTPDGNDMTGRWVKGTYQFTPNAHSWNVEITFEQNVS